jgi:hypothetical protein
VNLTITYRFQDGTDYPLHRVSEADFKCLAKDFIGAFPTIWCLIDGKAEFWPPLNDKTPPERGLTTAGS